MSQKIKHWSKIKEQSAGFWRLWFCLKIYQIFGKKTLRLALYPIVFFIFIFAKNARQASKIYLKRIYKIKTQRGESFRKPDIFSVFKHIFFFANSLTDRFSIWLERNSTDNLRIKTPSEVNEVLAEIENRRGVFLICSHLGNIEIGRAMSQRNLKINAITQYSSTPAFTNFLKKVNPDFAVNLISAADIGVETIIILKEKLQNGEIVVSAGDRTAANNITKVITVDFLGDKAQFPLGTFTLASLMESKVYFVFCIKNEKEDVFDFYLHKSKIDFISRANRKENLQKMVEEYTTYLENLCLKYPYQWYNFFNFWSNEL